MVTFQIDQVTLLCIFHKRNTFKMGRRYFCTGDA